MNKTIASQKTDYAAWYNDVIIQSGLAEHSPVRGCMIIKPYGYAIWENIKSILDDKFKKTGHVNAYFPLFIPKSFLSKEAAHVDGFAKECAVVTHYRLKQDNETKELVVDPEAKLEEELIVRPTSETIIWNAYRNWIKSHRDLPILINQWANVVRWEMRTRPFLRTAEFLWQEGHTAHASKEEAIAEAEKMNDLYADLMENYLALPVIKGKKTLSERFAGAVETYCVEALMRDGKALQAGTSHFLGQNFAKAFDVQFSNTQNVREYVWATSWGVSTRLIGALVMGHGDEKGLALPPLIAPIQAVVIPIYKGEESVPTLNEYAEKIGRLLAEKNIRFKIDADTQARPGWKYAEYEMKGVPLRIVFGQRDMDAQMVETAIRHSGEKHNLSLDQIASYVERELDRAQTAMHDNALAFRKAHTREANDFAEFERILLEEGGFVSAHWDGTAQTEERIKEKTKATIRCIPMDQKQEDGKCILTGKPSRGRVLFAIAY